MLTNIDISLMESVCHDIRVERVYMLINTDIALIEKVCHYILIERKRMLIHIDRECMCML